MATPCFLGGGFPWNVLSWPKQEKRGVAVCASAQGGLLGYCGVCSPGMDLGEGDQGPGLPLHEGAMAPCYPHTRVPRAQITLARGYFAHNHPRARVIGVQISPVRG